ncbi:hypothetical protein LCGC14_0906830 [marine sediment metagenome]|uniref:Uncharacterized protein n=1 Tax=marine sediment metagenome TaxID=412755 RepID=A0A0F9S1M7_9ZZZZ
MLLEPYSMRRVPVKVPANQILSSARTILGELEDDLFNDPIRDTESLSLHRDTRQLLTRLLDLYPDTVTVCRWTRADLV